MKEFIFPVKIVDYKCAKAPNNLLKKQPLQIGLAEVFTSEFNEGDYVVLDFGKEMCGGARILTFHSSLTRVRLRFGESLGECYADIGGEKNATNDHALRDFEIALPQHSDATLGDTGFRFLRIDFYDRVLIKSIVAANNILKRKAVYTYTGNDERIAEYSVL